MATTILKGKVIAVDPVTSVGEKATPLQLIKLFVPAYVDQFTQDKKGRDQYWCLQVMGDKVKQLNLSMDLMDKIIEAKCFLDSQFLEAKNKDQKGMYAVNVTLHSFTVVK